MSEQEWEIPANPGALASERVVLGAAIQSGRAAEELALTLSPEHFRDPSNITVFAAVLRLAESGAPVDPASVLGELAKAGMLGKIGGSDAGTGGAYLHTLLTAAAAHALDLRDGIDPTTAWHARKVRQEADRVRQAGALRSALSLTLSPAYDPDEHAEQVRKLLDDATADTGASSLRTQAEVMADVLERLESEPNPGLPTGIADLDAVIGGLRPGEMIVIGGRPSMGKSVLGLEFAEHIGGKLGLPVLLASLEMSSDEVAHRRIARHARVDLDRITRHELTDADWEKIHRAYPRLSESRLLVDDTPGTSLSRIRGTLRAMERKGEAARLVVIDYMGQLEKPSGDSHQVSVAALSGGTKRLAREMNIPVVLVVQLNRMPEGRTDKRPVMSDLRDSGQIEADADVVLLVHRDDYYDPECARAGEVDVIVAKQRQGQRLTVALSFQGHYARIADLKRHWTPSSAIGETA